MRGSAPLSNEGYSLVLDIYLGGVSGALIKQGTVEHSTHQKLPSPHTPTTSQFLQNIETLLYKVLDELIPRQTISKTFISIDAPFSYIESNEVLFQKNDKAFFETKTKEIFSELELPEYYYETLKGYASDGIIIEHPPRNHTINGYSTKNLHLEGVKMATVDQQWIQGNVYNLIQKMKLMYTLGEVTFLCAQKKEGVLILILGDYISTLVVHGKNIPIQTGVQKIFQSQAEKNNLSVSQVESVLKGIAREHGVKSQIYNDIINDISKTIIVSALKDNSFSEHKQYHCVYVGESYMLPLIRDTFSIYKNIAFTEIHKGIDARLIYIEKNNVQ